MNVILFYFAREVISIPAGTLPHLTDTILLQGTIVNTTYGRDENLYVVLFMARLSTVYYIYAVDTALLGRPTHREFNHIMNCLAI